MCSHNTVTSYFEVLIVSGFTSPHRIPKTCVRMQEKLRPPYTGPSRVPRSYVSNAKVSCYHDNIITLS